MLLSKCSVCDKKKKKKKKNKFLKEQEAKGLLSSLTGVKITIFR